MYRILLIIFSPVFLLCALVWLFSNLLFRVASYPVFSKGQIFVFIPLLLMVPVYPVIMIYSAEFIRWGKQTLQFDSSGIRVKSRFKKERRIHWSEIICLRKYFQGPFYEHRLELSNGENFEINSFTDLTTLKDELSSRNIAYILD